jgi:small subunit ribosomal protein S20
LPNTKAAKKAVRSSEPRRQRNKACNSLVKTNVKKAEGMVAAGDITAAEQAAAAAVQSLDNAAGKGIIRKNNAARRKSRLMKKLNTAKKAV